MEGERGLSTKLMLTRVKYMHYAIHKSRINSFVSFQCQERFLPPSNSPWVVALWAVAFFVWRNAAIAANQRHEGHFSLVQCSGDGDSSWHHRGDPGAMRGDPSNKIHTKYCVLYRLGYYVLTRLLWLSPRPLEFILSSKWTQKVRRGAQMYSFYKINFIDLTAVCYKVACSL